MLDGCTPWPEETAARYRAEGWWRGEDLSSLPQEWAARSGERTALVSAAGRLSYRELEERISRTAAGFAGRGVRRGDRAVLQLPNSADFVIVAFALFRIGAVPVFSLASHRSVEIGHLARLSGARWYIGPSLYRGFDHLAMATRLLAEIDGLEGVFVTGEIPLGARAPEVVQLEEVDGEPPASWPPADPSDVAFFLLSGGTTALPKLIPRTHDDYTYQVRAVAQVCGLGPDEVYLAALPVEFNFTWGCPGVVGTLALGGTVVIAEDPTADDCFALIEQEGVTITSLVPSVAQVWLETLEWADDVDLSSLQVVQIGGARLHPELAARVGPGFGCRLQQVFGMAEGLLSMSRPDDPAELVVHTQGTPISPGDEVRIVDESGAECAPGDVGELVVRGPYTLRGYYQAPEHNARAFTPEGFYHSGDLARITPEGQLVIEGRIKDVIIRGGDKISAAEIEAGLLAHPQLAQAALVGAPHELLGEQSYAFLVAAGAQRPTLAEVKDVLRRSGLADFKLPDRLEYVEELPLTPLRKIDKKVLAAAAADPHASRRWAPSPVRTTHLRGAVR